MFRLARAGTLLVDRTRGVPATAAGICALALLVVLAVVPSGVAQAQTAPPNLGTLTLTPAAGTDTTIINARTSAGCAAGTDSYNIRVTGPNNFDYPVTTTGQFGHSTTAAFDVAFEQSMKDAAALNTPATTLVAGAYLVTLNCADVFGISAGAFTATITFSSPTAYLISGAPPPPPGTGTTTTTALAVTPTSPVAADTESTLTATITPAAATGTVQFRNGSANVGSVATVTGGTATVKAKLPSGTNPLTAVFTGTGDFRSSTSPAVSYVVNASGAVPTTTTVTTTPASPVTAGTEVTLAAAVVPATAVGRVQFKDGSTLVGEPVTVSGGTASRKLTPTSTGSRTVTAEFIPTVPAAFSASTSAPVTLVVNAARSTTPPVSTPTVTPNPSTGSTGSGSPGALAYTGAPVVEMVVGGLASMALGTGLLLTARRRRLG